MVRGDSGFCREDGMARCEANRIDYLWGLAGTALASARCDTQRLKLLKIGTKLLAPPRPRCADARRALLRGTADCSGCAQHR